VAALRIRPEDVGDGVLTVEDRKPGVDVSDLAGHPAVTAVDEHTLLLVGDAGQEIDDGEDLCHDIEDLANDGLRFCISAHKSS
jgi:hypothetical protein